MFRMKKNGKIISCLCLILSMAAIIVSPVMTSADYVEKIYCTSSLSINTSENPWVFVNDAPNWQVPRPGEPASGNGGVDDLNPGRILYYKFDISNIVNEEIKNVMLRFTTRKISPAGTVTVKAVTEGWIDSAINDNITTAPDFTLSAESVTKALEVQPTDGVIKPIDIDVTAFVQAAQAAGKKTAQLQLTYSAGATSPGAGLRICSMVQPNEELRPTLIIAAEKLSTTFIGEMSEEKYMNDYLCALKDTNTNTTKAFAENEIIAGVSDSSYISIYSSTDGQSDSHDFYFRTDITSDIIDVPTKAILKLNIVKINKSGKLHIYKLNDDWIYDTDLTAAKVDALSFDTSNVVTRNFNIDTDVQPATYSFDVTNLITAGTVTKLYLRYEAKDLSAPDGLRFSYTGDLKPSIEIIKTMPITQITSAVTRITASAVLKEGTKEAPQSVRPVLTITNTKTKKLEKIVVGHDTDLTGEGNTVELSMDLSDITFNADYTVNYLLWDSMNGLMPFRNKSTIQYKPDSQIKNVIFLIPDGGGFALFDFANAVKENGGFNVGLYPNSTPLTTESMFLKEYLIGTETTRSASSAITDSAAAGTCLSSGYKTNNGYIGVDKNKVPHATILEAAQLKGKRTGIISTYHWAHATPASFTAHNISRNNVSILAEQIVNQGIDVVLGGGFSAAGWGSINEAVNRGYTITNNKTELSAVTSGTKVWGNHYPSTFPLDINLSAVQPNLAEMTSAAIRALDGSDKGFFLMVEGSQVDGGGHANDLVHAVSEYLAFDEACKVAINYAKSRNDTIVIAAPDHDTGGLILPNADNCGGNVNSKDYEAAVAEVKAGIDSELVSWETGDHTDRRCPVWLYAPEGIAPPDGLAVVPDDSPANRELIIDNTQISPYLAELMGLDLDAATEKLFVDVTDLGSYNISDNTFTFNNANASIKANQSVATVNNKKVDLGGKIAVYSGEKFYVPAELARLILTLIEIKTEKIGTLLYK